MFPSKSFPLAAAAMLLAFAVQVPAQSASSAVSASPAGSAGAASAASEAAKPTLRVQVVVTRFEGDKKVGSLPYTFIVAPNSNAMHLRFGVEVPIPVAGLPDGGKSGPVEYRSMGTNIDCYNVKELSGGRFQFDINVQNSAAVPGADGKVDGRPLFRQFSSSFTAILRDGQSMQAIASTDPVTGEVVRIEVTMNVVR